MNMEWNLTNEREKKNKSYLYDSQFVSQGSILLYIPLHIDR